MDINYDLTLIREVKKYTMLYNVNAKGYKNTEKKGRIWNAIGKRLNSTGRHCYRRWLSMRNSYKQNLKRLQKTGKEPSWIYFKTMQFLDKYPAPKQKTIFQLDGGQDSGECSNDADALVNNIDIMHDEDELCFQLIDEVQNHEILYNRKCVDYYDFGKRTEIWKGIAERLNKSESACKDKWRSFRDIYIKIKKKHASSTEPQDIILYRNPQWKFYDKMQFLENYIRINICNSNESNKQRDCHEISKNEYDTTMGDSDLQNTTEITSFDRQNDCSNESQKKMKSSFDRNDNFKLIELVKKHDILYARKWAGKSNIFRNRKWEEIAKLLNRKVQLCKDRWRRLRDQYIKIKRKIQSEDILADDKDPKWPYYEALAFLNDHIMSRKFPILLNINNIHESVSPNFSVIKTTVETNEDTNEDLMNSSVTSEVSVYENMENVESVELQSFTVEPFERHISTQMNNTVYKEEVEFDHDVGMQIDLQPRTDNVSTGEIEAFECERVTDTNSINLDDDNDNDDDDDQEPVLYLQSKEEGEDDTISSDSLLSSTSSSGRGSKRKLLKELSEFLKKSTQECASCVEQKINKNSTSLLFESLALSIKNSQLSDSDVLELQADIHSYVALKLVEYKKRR